MNWRSTTPASTQLGASQLRVLTMPFRALYPGAPMASRAPSLDIAIEVPSQLFSLSASPIRAPRCDHDQPAAWPAAANAGPEESHIRKRHARVAAKERLVMLRGPTQGSGASEGGRVMVEPFWLKVPAGKPESFDVSPSQLLRVDTGRSAGPAIQLADPAGRAHQVEVVASV